MIRALILCLLLSVPALGQTTVMPIIGTTAGGGTSVHQCGYPTIGANTANGINTFEWTNTDCIPGGSGTVGNACVYLSNVTSGGTFSVGVWDSNNSVVSGDAGTLICQATGSVPVSIGWACAATSGCGTLTNGHKYVLGFQFSDAVKQINYDGPTSGYPAAHNVTQSNGSFPTLTSITGNNNDGNNYKMSVYIEVTY